ncbi:hypothetical protein TNCV_4312291 [Trichonephila clavipes]|nr:hypothetical protein TNCV_4312291 [Trichonephila clavipes]
MDEQLKVLLEGINALKNGQEEIRQEMQKSQEETKNELNERMEKGQEETKKCQEDLKNSLEKKIDTVLKKKSTSYVEDLKKRLLSSENVTNEIKIVPAAPVHVPSSAVPLTTSPESVKLSTYDDGKTNWEVYKTQFSIISEANGWTEGLKAC